MMLLTTGSFTESVDCQNLRNFAQELGIQTKQPTIWSQLQSDCCTGVSGIVCINQRVAQIYWSNKGLNGVISDSYVPSGLVVLDLSNQFLIGSIPSSLPNSLSSLFLNSNKLTGVIPSSLPLGLHLLWVFGNQLSGDLPEFPSILQDLGLGYPGQPGNHFTGTLRLNRPAALYINDNWITDVIIQDTSALGMGANVCDLSNNPLLGNSFITGLSECYKGGIYSANLLPKTLTTIKPTTTIKLTSEMKPTTTVVKTPALISRAPSSVSSFSSSLFSATSSVLVYSSNEITLAVTAADTFTLSSSKLGSPMTKMSVKNLSLYKANYRKSEDILLTSHNLFISTILLESTTATPDANDQNPSAAIGDPILIYGILAGLFGLCVLVVIAGKVFKHPKMHSKFGRKNSFGTLNTVATGKS